MPPAPRVRLGTLRAGAGVLAATNVVVGLAVLLAGAPLGDAAEVGAVASAAPMAGTGPEAAPATVLVLSQHPLLATTSTAPSPATTAPPGTRPTPRPAAAADGSRRVVSTGYCLEGTTASGRLVGPGTVAMNGVPLGTRWRVHDGPFAGATLEVIDRIGHGTDFDIWFERCDDAMAYGRRTITVERVG